LGEIRVVFLAAVPLFLDCSHDPAVTQQSRRGIVVEGGDAQDMPQARHALEKRVESPGDAGTRSEHKHGSDYQQHEDKRNQPPFLLLPGELEELFK
jgi:hypothetical protein